MKLSFVTTIYKSASAIEEFTSRAVAAAEGLGFDYEIILVNDSSPDNGLAVARNVAQTNPKILVIDLARNFGQHKALWTGMAHATGDLIMIHDGDLEEDPMWSARFWEVMQETGCDVVYGVQSAPKGSFGYRRGREIFYRLLNTLTAFNFPKDVATARLITRRYLSALLQFDEREIFLVGIMHVAGFAQIGVHVDKQSRSETTYNPKKLFWLFLNAVTSFSVAPLAFIFLLGAVIFFVSLIFALYLIGSKLFGSVGVEGWVSVMAAISLSLGLTLLVNGIIAIYLATIFLEVKRRPLTVIREIINASKDQR